jgi:hypothetical protein
MNDDHRTVTRSPDLPVQLHDATFILSATSLNSVNHIVTIVPTPAHRSHESRSAMSPTRKLSPCVRWISSSTALLDIHFAAAVKQPVNKAGIPIISLDIPVPGTDWVGVNSAECARPRGVG